MAQNFWGLRDDILVTVPVEGGSLSHYVRFSTTPGG